MKVKIRLKKREARGRLFGGRIVAFAIPPLPCPVCGRHSFRKPADFGICPRCGWENDGSERQPDLVGANAMTFGDYKRRYERLVAEDPTYEWVNEE